MSISYKQINIHLDKAKKMAEMGEARFSLTSCRTCLELLVKQMSNEAGINSDTAEASLETMINQLFISNVTTDSEKDLMHRIRMESNKGAHIDIEKTEIPMDAVLECIDDLENLIESVSHNYSSEQMKKAEIANNVPMKNPDYFSQKRKFYGKWAQCKTMESLLVIPEYVELQKKAKEENDVEAMLNIASGFLSKEIEWNSNMLINMPGVMHRGKYYTQENAYDTRYYYWVQEAVFSASKKWRNNEYFPKKYIATAVWEFFLFWYYASLESGDIISRFYGDILDSNIFGLNHYVYDVVEKYNREEKQYEYSRRYKSQYDLFQPYYNSKSRILDEGILEFASYLFKTYTPNIVAPIYTDAVNPYDQICFMYDCIIACWSEEDELWETGSQPSTYNEKEVENIKTRLDTLNINYASLPCEIGKRIEITDYEIFVQGGKFYETVYEKSKRRVDYSKGLVKKKEQDHKRSIIDEEEKRVWKKTKKRMTVIGVIASVVLVLVAIPIRQQEIQRRQVPDMLYNPERVADFREGLIYENVNEKPSDKKNDTWHELVGAYYVSDPKEQTISNSELRLYYIVHNDPYSEYNYDTGEYALDYICYIGKEKDDDKIVFDKKCSWVEADRIEILKEKAEKGSVLVIDLTDELPPI